ncbi:MAG: four helix bundle protein [Thermodesulfovibrionia bacterium]|nr:four helix bundle protein [Thermodesulfovibrionia bacterium]
MAVRYFEDLEVWKLAREITRQIYELTKKKTFTKDYGLVDQIRRASVSVMSNISEGFERGGNQEFKQFLYVAKGSCGEIRCQLYVALDQKYIMEMEMTEAVEKLKKLSIMLNNLIQFLKRSKFRGGKYK